MFHEVPKKMKFASKFIVIIIKFVWALVKTMGGENYIGWIFNFVPNFHILTTPRKWKNNKMEYLQNIAKIMREILGFEKKKKVTKFWTAFLECLPIKC